MFTGCSGDTAGPEVGADVQDLQNDPDAGPGVVDDFAPVGQLVGQQITVSAKVSEVLGPYTFTIADQSGETVLVVYDGAPQDVAAGTGVRVTGTVRSAFAVGEAEQFAGAELDEDELTEFNTDPYIQAARIDVTTSFDNR